MEKLRELFELTAAAFYVQPISIVDTNFDNALRIYAVITRDMAQRQIISGEDVSQLKRRLFDGAFRLGDKLRREMAIHSRKDALKAAKLLYRTIGIDFHCNDAGEVKINCCYFASYYSCDVCRIVSSLDEGLIAGLTDGGRLWFLSRITEGNNSCVGQIEFERAGTG